MQAALVPHGVLQLAEMRRAAAAAACWHGGGGGSSSSSSSDLSHNASSAGGAAETVADFSRNFSRCVADAALTAQVCVRTCDMGSH